VEDRGVVVESVDPVEEDGVEMRIQSQVGAGALHDRERRQRDSMGGGAHVCPGLLGHFIVDLRWTAAEAAERALALALVFTAQSWRTATR